MALKGREKFVADRLVAYYKNQGKVVDYKEGEDPPDIDLNIDQDEVAVEITELDTNVLNDRKTIDTGYLQFIDSLNQIHMNQLPTGIGIAISFYHNNVKIGKIKKEFIKKLLEFITVEPLVVDMEEESSIGRVSCKMTVIKAKKGKRGFAGFVHQYGGNKQETRDINKVSRQLTEANLSTMASKTIINRIEDKNKKCAHLNMPIQLALYDNYYNKFASFKDNSHIEFYIETMEHITNFGLFKKVYIVFENGDVLEFTNKD